MTNATVLDGLDCRRYLTPFDTRAMPIRWTDVLVLGSGVAGLTAALEAAETVNVIVATKASPEESNTRYAQGGVAAVTGLNPQDSFEGHVHDTLEAGGGLCDPEVVEMVVREGAEGVKSLIELGAQFDVTSTQEIALTREGGHTHARILHANGDATGEEIERALLAKAKAHPRIRFLEHAFALDLVTSEGQCHGALIWDHGQGMQFVAAWATILASGGAGRVFRETTNPSVATGDGIAMAYRAGARLMDMEFVQFHPTTLYIAGAARRLLTEALRGEGAHLVDSEQVRFMSDLHPMGDLAPRDVVSRAIVRRHRETGGLGVFLDLRHLEPEALRKRFPGIDRLCRSYGLDFTRDPLPVYPSAHYTIGGVEVDLEGATTLPRLFAIGEVSCTKLHGANRLASNSLLEGLAYGRRAARAAANLARDSLGGVARLPLESSHEDPPPRAEIDLHDVLATLRTETWRYLGIERDADGLARANERIRFWCGYVLPSVFAGPLGWELQNMLTVAAIMTQSATWRKESRGAHHRLDTPEPDDARFKVHSQVAHPNTP